MCCRYEVIEIDHPQYACETREFPRGSGRQANLVFRTRDIRDRRSITECVVGMARPRRAKEAIVGSCDARGGGVRVGMVID